MSRYQDKFKAAREEALEAAGELEAPAEEAEDTEDRRPVQTTTALGADFTANVTPPAPADHFEAQRLEAEAAQAPTDSTGEETPA